MAVTEEKESPQRQMFHGGHCCSFAGAWREMKGWTSSSPKAPIGSLRRMQSKNATSLGGGLISNASSKIHRLSTTKCKTPEVIESVE